MAKSPSGMLSGFTIAMAAAARNTAREGACKRRLSYGLFASNVNRATAFAAFLAHARVQQRASAAARSTKLSTILYMYSRMVVSAPRAGVRRGGAPRRRRPGGQFVQFQSCQLMWLFVLPSAPRRAPAASSEGRGRRVITSHHCVPLSLESPPQLASPDPRHAVYSDRRAIWRRRASLQRLWRTS